MEHSRAKHSSKQFLVVLSLPMLTMALRLGNVTSILQMHRDRKYFFKVAGLVNTRASFWPGPWLRAHPLNLCAMQCLF